MADIVAVPALDEAARVVRRRAHTFYLASLVLPATTRRNVHAVYAFYRTVDDLVDDPPAGLEKGDLHRQLDAWQLVLEGKAAAATPLFAAVLRIAAEYAVPHRHLTMILEGARRDIDSTCIQTRDDLAGYAELVAGSVGMVMCRLLGAGGETALSAARDLGIAMQITNVLRDVDEDLRAGRIYLPADDLHRHGCGHETLERGAITPGFSRLMAELTEWAREYYRSGMTGIHYLPARSQFSVHLAATLYAGILDKIEAEGYDVFGRRAHLGRLEKWTAVVPAYRQLRRERGA